MIVNIESLSECTDIRLTLAIRGDSYGTIPKLANNIIDNTFALNAPPTNSLYCSDGIEQVDASVP